MSPTPLHLAVALDGAGWHPAAWRDPSARPGELFTAKYWADLVRTAERGLLDFVTIEDSFGVQSTRFGAVDARTDQVRGRLDAVLIASYVGPVTHSIGLIPTVSVTHTEPFHVASATATLDYISKGRAGWRPQVSARPDETGHVGRRPIVHLDPRRIGDPAIAGVVAEIFDEAADAVEVIRRLWDSWEDDAIIKDVATGRFIDRDRLHYIDFAGKHFSVKGPSIVPRPPQGQPVVAALAHSRVPLEFAARSADVVFVTPASGTDVADWVGQVRAAESAVVRTGAPLKVLADLVVALDVAPGAAAARLARLDDLDGAALHSDAAVFAGTPDDLAEQLADWQAGGVDGFRLRPLVIGHDLDAIVDDLAPALRRRGLLRDHYAERTLRPRLGLDRPASRYAAARVA